MSDERVDKWIESARRSAPSLSSEVEAAVWDGVANTVRHAGPPRLGFPRDAAFGSLRWLVVGATALVVAALVASPRPRESDTASVPPGSSQIVPGPHRSIPGAEIGPSVAPGSAAAPALGGHGVGLPNAQEAQDAPEDVVPGPSSTSPQAGAAARPRAALKPRVPRKRPAVPRPPVAPTQEAPEEPPVRDDLGEQVRLLSAAQTALAAHSYAKAATLARTYAERFPEGQFVPDIAAIRALARCAQSPTDADDIREAFRRRYKDGIHAARVERRCGRPQP